MNWRKIESIVHFENADNIGDGFRMMNFIPNHRNMSMVRMRPFLMLDYNPVTYFPSGSKVSVSGAHPHKGYETVSIVYNGVLNHRDSSGNSFLLEAGDVHWMTAGNGIVHQENIDEHFMQKGGLFQYVQLWVNLPKEKKGLPAGHQLFKNDQLTKVKLDNNAGMLEIIAGEFGDDKGMANTQTAIHVYNLLLNEDGEAEIILPAKYNTGLLVVDGHILLNDETPVPERAAVVFANNAETFKVRSTSRDGATVLIFSGEIIDEEISAHGPFIMNKKQEVIEAYNDFKAGKLGN